ncbi:MAG: MFS transporter [Dehalococcoidia bacterium]
MASKASADPVGRGRSLLGLPNIYYGYWLVGAAFIAQFVAVGSQNYVVGTFFKPMTEDLGWTRSEYTIARTLGQFVMAFTGLVIGAQVDKHGARRFMLVGACILSAALFLLGSVHALWQWILLNGLILTAGSAMIGNLVVNTTLAKWFVEKRGLAIALGAMGISFAGVALVPLATVLIDTFGWRATWRLLAAGTAALILPLAFVMRRAPEDHGLHPDGMSAESFAAGAGEAANADLSNSMTRREALHTVSFYMLVVAFGLFGLTIGVMLLQTIAFMTDEGYGRGLASLMITLTSIPALVSKPIWGFFIDRADARRLAAGSAALTGLAMFVITLSVPAHHDLVVYAGFFLLGCGWGGMLPLQEVIWASFFGRLHIGAVRSAGLPFALLLGAGAPLLASYYFDKVGNYHGAFLAIAALNGASALMLLFIPRPSRRLPPVTVSG